MSAVISACGTYRYRLTRSVGMGSRVVTFIGINPSTADATVDDATVRKWCGFAKRWGYDRIEVVNLFAFRSKDVRVLATTADSVGPENDRHIQEAVAGAGLVVPCWGSTTKLPSHLCVRVAWVCELLYAHANVLRCLGVTKRGDPRHPLMLGYDTPLVRWP